MERIPNYMGSCCFCLEFEEGFPFGGNEWKNRIVLETDTYVVFPPLGPLLKGHVLIAPKEHYVSLLQVWETHFEEFLDVELVVKEALKKNYGCEMVSFEHGLCSTVVNKPECIQHAHMHIIPRNIELTGTLKTLFDESDTHCFSSIEELALSSFSDRSYYLVEESTGLTFFDVNAQLSNIPRTMAARLLGVPEKANWKNNYGLEIMKDTYEAMKNALKRAERK